MEPNNLEPLVVATNQPKDYAAPPLLPQAIRPQNMANTGVIPEQQSR